jgi:hypothetical protein
MRELTADLFVSLDGFAAGVDVGPYFGYFGPELADWVRTELDRPQVIVMGRVTTRRCHPWRPPPTRPPRGPTTCQRWSTRIRSRSRLPGATPKQHPPAAGRSRRGDRLAQAAARRPAPFHGQPHLGEEHDGARTG